MIFNGKYRSFEGHVAPLGNMMQHVRSLETVYIYSGLQLHYTAILYFTISGRHETIMTVTTMIICSRCLASGGFAYLTLECLRVSSFFIRWYLLDCVVVPFSGDAAKPWHFPCTHTSSSTRRFNGTNDGCVICCSGILVERPNRRNGFELPGDSFHELQRVLAAILVTENPLNTSDTLRRVVLLWLGRVCTTLGFASGISMRKPLFAKYHAQALA